MSSASVSEAAATTLQQMDRLVSASSPSDALDSLTTLVASLREDRSVDETDIMTTIISTLTENTEFIKCLCTLLSECRIGKKMIVEDGDTAVCDLLLVLLQALGISTSSSSSSTTSNTSKNNINPQKRKYNTMLLKKLLTQSESKSESEGMMVHSLLDLLCPYSDDSSSNTSTSIYARISAMNILSQLTQTLPTLSHSQILSAPDGLHRIVNLLTSTEDSLRNEAVLFCTVLARTSAASARLLIFSETYEKVLDIAQNEFRNGNASSSVLVCDCLNLVLEMTRRDGMGSEVFLGSRSLVGVLAGFLDLRFGRRFRFPEESVDMSGKNDNKEDDEEDLDDILNGSTKPKNIGKEKSSESSSSPTAASIPYLTTEETSIVMLALELLQTLILGDESEFNTNSTSMKISTSASSIKKRQSRQRSILSHDHLSRFLLDMGLYTLPPPNSPHNYYVSAVPPLEVQLSALSVTACLAQNSGDELHALLLKKQSIYLQNVGVLERLMYLICTGAGLSKPKYAAGKISMHALGVLREVLDEKEASLMVLHSLAPPPPDDEDQKTFQQPEVPVVQKLVNTLAENLHVLGNEDFCKQKLTEWDLEQMHVNIVGAAGALGVFLTNGAGETAREMLLKINLPPPPTLDFGNEDTENYSSTDSVPETSSTTASFEPSNLMECILQFLETCSDTITAEIDNTNRGIYRVSIALLRLLAEWVPSTPSVISALFTNASSLSLGVMLQSGLSSSKKKIVGNFRRKCPSVVQALTGLLLGLCLEHIRPEEDIGGWSRSSIMNLISVGLGIGKFTQLLEGLKPFILAADNDSNGEVGPWIDCKSERLFFSNWYSENVNIVRRRAVQELTLSGADGGSSDGEDDDEHKNETPSKEDVPITGTSRSDIKSLTKLISQQSFEIESLRKNLSEANKIAEMQTLEIKEWKRRIESNPTQLDDMLNEYYAKINDLEASQQELKNDMLAKEKKYETTLQEKENEASKLRKDLAQSREDLIVVEDERNVVQEEMKGLSCAYNNLEREYNQLASISDNGPTPAAASTGEVTESPSKQDNGDGTSEIDSSSLDLDMLKKENVKLKTDIRAANDWMKMAVKRIEELGNSNSILNFEVKQLKDAEANNSNKFANSNTPAEANLTQNVVDQQRLKNLTDEITKAQLHLNETKLECESWRTKALSIERDLETSKHTIGKLQAATIDNEKEKADLHQALEETRNQVKDKSAESAKIILSLQEAIKRKDDVISSIEDRLNTPISVGGPTGEETNKLRAEINKLKTSNKAAQDWMANAMKHNETLVNNLNEKKKENSILKSEVDTLRESMKDAVAACEASSKTKMAQLQSRIYSLEQEREETGKKLVILEKSLQEKDRALSESMSLEDSLSRKKTGETESLKIQLLNSEKEVDTLKNKINQLQETFHIEELKLKEESTTLMEEVKLRKDEILQSQDELENTRKRLTIESEAKSSMENSLRDEISHLKKTHEEFFKERDEQISSFTLMQNETETLKEQIETLTVERDVHVSTIEDMRNRLTEFKSWTETAQERIAELEADKEAAEVRIKTLEDSENHAREELKVVREDAKKLKENQEVLTQNKLHTEITDSKVKELESTVASLEVQIGNLDGRNRAMTEDNKVLEGTNLELSRKLEDLEESLFEKESVVADLEGELAESKKELEELHMESENVVRQWEERVKELESSLSDLEEQLDQQKTEASDAILQWEERCKLLETNSTNFSLTIGELESSIENLKEDLTAKSLSLSKLTNSLEIERASKAENKAKFLDNENTLKKHIQELESSVNDLEDTIEEMQSQLDERDETVTYAEEQITMLTKELVESREQSEEVVQQWQENTQQLESTIADLEKTIEGQHAEANGAISQWEARCNALSEQIEEMEQVGIIEIQEELANLKLELSQKESDLEREKSKSDGMQASLAELSDQLKDSQSVSAILAEMKIELQSVQKSRDDLTKSENELKEALEFEKRIRSEIEIKLANAMKSRNEVEKSEANVRNAEKSWKEEKRSLEESLETIKTEAYELRIIIGQLEDELQESNDALQSYLTDEVSTRATEMATEALRSQLEKVREKHALDQQSFVMEQESRILAEQEVERLKADLALLCQAGVEKEGDGGRITKLTSKAADEIVRKEREEIQGIRTTLDRVMKELDSCRAKERDAEERAASSRLHASVCEQELMAVKSDLSFLNQSMKDLQEAETNARSSLEYRINDLEDDRETMNRAHGDEIESLKTELAQGQMERERLAHALSESEKANSALVYSTTAENDEDGSSSDATEVLKLRLEKAQLLASSVYDGSKSERRIREAIAANASFTEAEVILERELREAAEEALEDMQKQLEALQSKKIETNGDDDCSGGKEDEQKIEASNLKRELNRLSIEISNLKESNRELKLKLEKSEVEANSTVMKLTEKCRLAEARAREVEREGHFEAAVAAEVARIRAESSHTQNTIGNIHSSTADTLVLYKEVDTKNGGINGEEKYDFALKQLAEIKEERAMYYDLLNEHKQLLALLAQQDLEKATLQSTLSEIGGQDAVDKAVHEAEEKALQQFGNYIRVH